MVITELVQEFVLVSVVPVSDLTFCLGIPLIFCVGLVAVEVDLPLRVLVVRIFLYSHGSLPFYYYTEWN